MTARSIRTLVVDDSIFMRTVLKGALDKAEGIDVVGSAQNGNEALKKIKELKPDVVTLDIEMPGLTGLQVLERVMKDKPLPVVMVSTKTQEGANMTFDALELGAVDYVAKPLGEKNATLSGFREDVVAAVRGAFASNRKRIAVGDKTRVLRPRKAALNTGDSVVAIGISAGGPATLHKMIPAIPKEFPPIVLTQHMPADFTGPFARRLNDDAAITVKEAQSGDRLVPNHLFLAPGDRHLRITQRGGKKILTVDNGPKVSGFRPSVDVMLESVAKEFGASAIALVMTGMGIDGAAGIQKIKKAGGRTLAQDQESSIVYGMPKAAFETGCVDQVVSLAEIPDALVRMLSQVGAAAR